MNIPETVIFEAGKPRTFLKTDKEGCVVHHSKNKRELMDVGRHFIVLCTERKKLLEVDK